MKKTGRDDLFCVITNLLRNSDEVILGFNGFYYFCECGWELLCKRHEDFAVEGNILLLEKIDET